MTAEEAMVSVMTPYYNDDESLGLALGSLLAQSYSNWECVVVDDGSSTNPKGIVDSFHDPRIRLIRHEQNLGRGAARRTALKELNGEYLTFLDADDWMYPTKIQAQVEALQSHPDAVICGHAVAAIDECHNLLGIGGRVPEIGPRKETLLRFKRIKAARFPYVTAMIRMDHAKNAAYDVALRRSQDFDFLLQTGLGKDIVILSDALYAYTGWAEPSLEKSLNSLKYERLILRKYISQLPVDAMAEISKSLLKSLVYLVTTKMGQEARIYGRRMTFPTKDDQVAYQEARRAVAATTLRDKGGN